jgi:UDP-N-acetylmuramate dehydrogenase
MTATDVEILSDQPIPTWFGCGGGAKRMAKPTDVEQLKRCLEIDPNLRVLGDGANLLVADTGVSELVVALEQGVFNHVSIDDATGIVRAGAGVKLPKLINDCVRVGLGGLEVLGGIPASVGGAIVMNAGGNFGQTGDVVAAVHTITRQGQTMTFKRNAIEFTYRHTRFGDFKNLIITGADFKLRRGSGDQLRAKLLEVMKYKKDSQPLGDRSAGCAFKNPILKHDLPGIAVAGSKVSAGMLIDKAGCKGLTIGGAQVSDKHGNFLTAGPGCKAEDVLNLMREVRARVQGKFGLALEPEVQIWGATL